jgi:hypothetical protein
MRVGGGVIFRDVHMDGGVELSGTTIGADLILDGSFLMSVKNALVWTNVVNLRQEQHWWPDESASECTIFGLKIPVRGSVLRYYLWLQVIAGWLLSAIFIAGVTGLIHND